MTAASAPSRPGDRAAATRDRRLLYAAAFLRALGIGIVGVLLGIHLARLDVSVAAIGGIVASGLAGSAIATACIVLVGDRLSRRTWLVLLTSLAAVGTGVLAWCSTPWILSLASAVGMVNGMGRDRGAALVVEQAALPSTTSDQQRTPAFAWYGLLQDTGHAIGGLVAALPVPLRGLLSVDEATAVRLVVSLPALLAVTCLLLYRSLSGAVNERSGESNGDGLAGGLSPPTRRIVGRIGSLFALDSIGGGFVATSMLAFFLYERFGVDEAALGLLFFAARIANALSHLAAAWLAKRIGLVNTMVFTHVPSSLLLLTIPWAPTFPVAAALFLLREALVEMDVPTRQSYVMAVVRPDERTVVSAATHIVRLAGWAIAPALAGVAMQTTQLAAPLFVGAGLKITYDGLLYAWFRRLRPPEEVDASPER